jgi:hypothetical protein
MKNFLPTHPWLAISAAYVFALASWVLLVMVTLRHLP